MGDAMSDGDRDYPTPEQKRAARRAAMTEHGRAVEDAVDDYTECVKNAAALEFFGRVARDRLLIRNMEQRERIVRDREARIAAMARNLQDLAAELLPKQ